MKAVIYVKQSSTNFVRSRVMEVTPEEFERFKSRIGKTQNGYEVIKVEELYF